MTAMVQPVRRFAEYENVVDLVWLRDRLAADRQMKSLWDDFHWVEAGPFPHLKDDPGYRGFSIGFYDEITSYEPYRGPYRPIVTPDEE